jgi:hypothetical protein
MDGKALAAGIFSVIMSALAAYQAVTHRRWEASGVAAFGCGALLNIVTEGNHSHAEHNVVFAVSLTLLAYYLITVLTAWKTRRHQSGRPTSS